MGAAIAVCAAFAALFVGLFCLFAWQTWTGTLYVQLWAIRKNERPILFWSIAIVMLLFTGCEAVGLTRHLVERLSGRQ